MSASKLSPRNLLILALTLFTVSAGHAARYAPDRIIVKFKPGTIQMPQGLRAADVSAVSVKDPSLRALNSKHRVVRVKQLYAKVLEIKPEWTELADDYVLYLSAGEGTEGIAAEYRGNRQVRDAAVDSIVSAFVTTPNDPRYLAGDQYGLAKISAPLAWDRTTGANGILVAVLDTGINYIHEDLQGRIDLANGYDFVWNDTNPWDDHYGVHGTCASGIIAAATNNGKGVAGVTWQAKILPIKVLNQNGDGYMTDILQGIAWARAKGADIINMSFGQYSNDNLLRQACLDAYNDGLVLVAAAGNGNIDWPTYPAYLPTVLAVGATDQNDQRSVWSGIDPSTGRIQASNYGSWVNVCAPGTAIMTTQKNLDLYTPVNGTSFAAPFVAGAAALVKAANPALTNRQIMDKLTREADVISTDQPIGKRLNVYLAVAGVISRIDVPTSGAYVTGTVEVTGHASGWDYTGYRLEAFQGSTLLSTIAASSASVESGVLGSWETAGLNGAYTLKLSVFSVGASTEETMVDIFVDNTLPRATIYYPPAGTALAGLVTVIGTAEDQYLDYYSLEYGAGTAPTIYLPITQGYSSVNYGFLGSWETSGLNGAYQLRLTVRDRVGQATVAIAQVTLSNTGPVVKEVLQEPGLPLTYALPNPFDRSVSPEVSLNYDLSGNFDVRIYIFDLNGNLIWQRGYSAGSAGGKSGRNGPAWSGVDQNGRPAPNGLYLYQIVADQKPLARGKIIVLN